MSVLKADICVIGAGSAGLSVAAGAAQMGARTILVEKGKMGGDCLNYGCVPSKALLAAAKMAASQRSSAPFGIVACEPRIDFAKVMEHVAAVVAAIAPHDSVARFEGLGVRVIRAPARFTGPGEIEAGGDTVRARRFVIAAGSSPALPAIPGLAQVPYFTNETIFANRACPAHLVIIGGGPIGMEMAQAHVRLGAKVTLLEMARVLPKDDPELAAIVKDRLRADGVVLREGVKVGRVDGEAGRVVVQLDEDREQIVGSHLLVATGRMANIAGLDLAAAGVAHDNRGIKVDARLRTSNKRVYAIGDVIGGLQFTHVAGYHAGIVIRNALFRLPAKVNLGAVPWVTYTDPELAHVGLTEAEARQRHGDKIRVLTWPLQDNDRAQAEHTTSGLIKVTADRRGRILGASIVAPHAGDIVHTWVLAMSAGLKISALANYIAPYPTLGEISKRVAGSYYTPTLFGRRVRWMVKLLAKLG